MSPAPAVAWPGGTTTFLFTDIQGSTQLWEQYPQAMPAALQRHEILLRQAIAEHRGVVFKTVGDAVCAAFASALDALAAALDSQRALVAEAWDANRAPSWAAPARADGAAHGRSRGARGRLLGPPLNRVARLLATAHGGQILLSRASAELVADGLPAAETLLPSLLNAVSARDAACVLVLDDYHVIEAPAIHAALTFLLDQLPPRLHLVIASRADPPLPLPRLRVRGDLTELRAADLRFTPAEAATFLTEVMGVPLAPEDVAALETRTEGWIAGLQLAALAMRDRHDHAGFISAFTGSHRFVGEYLADEVFVRQPSHIQTLRVAHASVANSMPAAGVIPPNPQLGSFIRK